MSLAGTLRIMNALKHYRLIGLCKLVVLFTVLKG